MLVSCIMATANRRRFVPDAVAAFQKQTLRDSELIVIDDGTDSIMDLIPPTGRFRYAQPSSHQHFCGLRDIAMRFANGRYIAVWDDDDISHPERLAVQVGELERTKMGLCLLSSSIVTREDPPDAWVYTPVDPYKLDNSAVLVNRPGFEWSADKSCYAALRALKAAFVVDLVVVHGRPELLVTRRHDGNTCARPVGEGPDWSRL
jgi:glycosyltransferase involved in cell wall biosynthesis